MTAAQMPDLSRVVSITEAAKRTMSDDKMTNVMTIKTPFDRDGDAQSYKWSELRDRLGLNSNVANARWMPEKLLPLFADLKAPDLLTPQGKPTKFCAQMLARYKTFCNDDKNDYEVFAEQVRSHFATDTAKAVAVEVLQPETDSGSSVSSGDAPSPLATKQQQIEGKAETLEDKIMLAIQLQQQVGQLAVQYQETSEKSWEQQVIEDEIEKFNQEQERKKKEIELRLQVRQMLEKNGSNLQQPS